MQRLELQLQVPLLRVQLLGQQQHALGVVRLEPLAQQLPGVAQQARLPGRHWRQGLQLLLLLLLLRRWCWAPATLLRLLATCGGCLWVPP